MEDSHSHTSSCIPPFNALDGAHVDQFDEGDDKPAQSMMKSFRIYFAMIPVSLALYAIYHFYEDHEVWGYLSQSAKSSFQEYAHLMPEQPVVGNSRSEYSLRPDRRFHCLHHVHLNKGTTSVRRHQADEQVNHLSPPSYG